MKDNNINNDHVNITQEFYNASYALHGMKAQRKYPNEELCRFMGRNFSDNKIPLQDRKNIRILETGCGSGANLWMIAKEGFDTYGIDLSQDGIKLASQMLANYNVSAHLSVQDMSQLDFPENYFDGVVDVFSSYCLNKKKGIEYIKGVNNVLKSGGLFFSYFPSKKSDAFLYTGDSNYIDSDTLNGISRNDSPYYGNIGPFRFMHIREYEQILIELGFTIQYSEILTKTYFNQKEEFSFVLVEARKI